MVDLKEMKKRWQYPTSDFIMGYAEDDIAELIAELETCYRTSDPDMASATTIVTTGASIKIRDSTVTLEMSQEDFARLCSVGIKPVGMFVTFAIPKD